MLSGVKSAHSDSAEEGRLKRLASRIEALAEKDAQILRSAQEMAEVRRAAAVEIYRICGDFVTAVNQLLPNPEVVIDPADCQSDTFSDLSLCLIQINVRGRILQVEYGAAEMLVSTEEFRIPYTLSGSVRAFNQELLEKDIVEEQLLFYTVEKRRHMWRFFDARTYRSGPFDQSYLISLLEQLL
jgi:hypothetical protein